MRVVCFGDSVTRGISFVHGRLRIIRDNYPALLQTGLAAHSVEVVNEGIFNNNSDDLVRRLQSDVIAKEPDYVIIGIGGNDCNFNWAEVAERPAGQHEPIVPLERYISNVVQLVEDIRDAGATPILLNLPPLDPVRYYNCIASLYGSMISHWIARCGGIEHWHGMYNRSLKEITETLKVITVDVRTAFKQADSLSNLLSDDGIHPTRTGYQIMGRVIADTLRLELIQLDLKPEWVSRYLNHDERRTMRDVAKQSFSNEALTKLSQQEFTEEIHQQYSYFYGELRRLVAENADPASEEAQSLACYLTDLNKRRSQGWDVEILAGMKKTWEAFNSLPEERKPQIYTLTSDEREFIKHACSLFHAQRSGTRD